MTRVFYLGLFGVAATLMTAPSVSAQTAAGASKQTSTYELAAQTQRPRITIYPRRRELGPNARRECRAKLVQEYRVSGTVIVPKMTCWWE
jgi:hypothetical protein